MNAMTLIHAIQDIPDSIIAEYITQKHKTSWHNISKRAAVICLVMTIGSVIAFFAYVLRPTQGIDRRFEYLDTYSDLCEVLPEDHLLAKLDFRHFEQAMIDYKDLELLSYGADMEVRMLVGFGLNDRFNIYYTADHNGTLRDYVDEEVHGPGHAHMLLSVEEKTVQGQTVFVITRSDTEDTPQFWRLVFMIGGDLYNLEFFFYTDAEAERIIQYLEIWFEHAGY